MVKKGDTLVEVLLAVGIFSMIAISVVAVMNGGTSEAQLALETTLARQEIDAQAEALRYIHDSYIIDKNTNNKNDSAKNLPTVALWNKITSNAIKLSGDGSERDINIVEYAPTSCKNIAEDTTDLGKHAFILNTRQLRLNDAVAYIPAREKNNANQIFQIAQTYPRLRFEEDSKNLITNDASTLNAKDYVGDAPKSTELQYVDGLYIIAVADSDTTEVLDIDGNQVEAKKGPAFYDFYIRSCWYGIDADVPSTISTVIRLHNPDVATKYYSYTSIVCDEEGECSNQRIDNDRELENRANIIDQPGWTFQGWCDIKINPKGGTCPPDNRHDSGAFYSEEPNGNYAFTPIWSQTQYTIIYDSNGSSWSRPNQICTVPWGSTTGDCIIAADEIKRSGYVFEGWCDGEVNTQNGTCSGTKYTKGQNIKVPFPNNAKTITLKAIWREHNETITIRLAWNQSIDYDAHLIGTKSDGSSFSTDFIIKEPTETVSGVTRVLAKLDHDCISNFADYCKPTMNETITINTLGGRNYYFYAHNFLGTTNITGATVTVQGPSIGTRTFSSDRNISGSGIYWNVFAYKDGELITPGANGTTTRSSSPNTSY